MTAIEPVGAPGSDTWCDTCDADTGGGSHYHCGRCMDPKPTSMLGHFVKFDDGESGHSCDRANLGKTWAGGRATVTESLIREEWERPTDRMALSVVMDRWRPGSRGPEWTWQDEQIDVWNHGQRTRELLREVAREGVREPVLLGNDGRVWDGHHRVCIAEWIGIEEIPVEIVPDETAGAENELTFDEMGKRRRER